MTPSLRLTVASLVLASLVGCTTTRQVHTSASSARFLFGPGAQSTPPPGTSVELEVPLRVAIAFVPLGEGHRPRSDRVIAPLRVELLEEVRDAFDELEFVETIETVPEGLLDARGGLVGLRRVARFLGADVVALLGYDEVQFTDTSPVLGIAHLTLVGQYVVPSEKNETRTLMEASVFDVGSGGLLLHARSTDEARTRSTLAGAGRRLRTESEESFRDATVGLVASLRRELDGLEETIGEGGQVYGRSIALTPRDGGSSGASGSGSGAGDLGAVAFVLALVSLLGSARRPDERRKSGRC